MKLGTETVNPTFNFSYFMLFYELSLYAPPKYENLGRVLSRNGLWDRYLDKASRLSQKPLRHGDAPCRFYLDTKAANYGNAD